MLLSEMRDKYTQILAGVGESDTAKINALLNGAYQFTLPAIVPGQRREKTWTLTTTASDDEYDFPDWVIGPRKGAVRSDDTMLDYWTEPAYFWAVYERSASEGAPTAALYYDRKVTLRPVPDDAYTIYVPVSGGPDTELSADGDEIADYNHAQCVVTLAAMETAEDFEMDELHAKLERRLARFLTALRRASVSRPRERHLRPDF